MSENEHKPDIKPVRALQAGFKALYQPKYTANHKAKQMIINIEIEMKLKDETIHMHNTSDPVGQVQSLPKGMYQANRYDTDNESVLHLWNDKGESFDIAVKKPHRHLTVEGDEVAPSL